jgi:hypothetical protein
MPVRANFKGVDILIFIVTSPENTEMVIGVLQKVCQVKIIYNNSIHSIGYMFFGGEGSMCEK